MRKDWLGYLYNIFLNLSKPWEWVNSNMACTGHAAGKVFFFSAMLNEDIISSESVSHC